MSVYLPASHNICARSLEFIIHQVLVSIFSTLTTQQCRFSCGKSQKRKRRKNKSKRTLVNVALLCS